MSFYFKLLFVLLLAAIALGVVAIVLAVKSKSDQRRATLSFQGELAAVNSRSRRTTDEHHSLRSQDQTLQLEIAKQAESTTRLQQEIKEEILRLQEIEEKEIEAIVAAAQGSVSSVNVQNLYTQFGQDVQLDLDPTNAEPQFLLVAPQVAPSLMTVQEEVKTLEDVNSLSAGNFDASGSDGVAIPAKVDFVEIGVPTTTVEMDGYRYTRTTCSNAFTSTSKSRLSAGADFTFIQSCHTSLFNITINLTVQVDAVYIHDADIEIGMVDLADPYTTIAATVQSVAFDVHNIVISSKLLNVMLEAEHRYSAVIRCLNQATVARVEAIKLSAVAV